MEGIHPDSLNSLEAVYKLNALKEMKRDFETASGEFDDRKLKKFNKEK